MEYPEISIVIGSWGSYNSCNERALGSEWLNLADFESWEEIEEELKKQGFQLKGIDEELFIQDTSTASPRPARTGITFIRKTSLKYSKRAVFWTITINTIRCLPIWKYAPSRSLKKTSAITATAGTTTSASTKVTAGKITAKKCSTAVAIKWKNIYWISSTSRHTADIWATVPRNTRTASSKF